MPRRKWHRRLFAAAGAYNIAFGIFAALAPEWLFRFSGLAPLNHPAIFSCLGMVVGLYGVLYLEVARMPERGWLIAAVGLTGKLLGPVGMATLVLRGVWPPRMAVLCLFNDAIWWLPFALYLRDGWPWFAADISQGD